jgi:hypothetical protein
MESGRIVEEDVFKAVFRLELEIVTGKVVEGADTAANVLGVPKRRIEKMREITGEGLIRTPSTKKGRSFPACFPSVN